MKLLHRVLFIRHGETVANTGGFFVGRTDVGLTDTGIEQVHHAADAVASFAPDRILTSPLSRCRAIANEAGEKLGLEPQVYDDIVELNFGVMEGKPFAKLGDYGVQFPWPRDDEGHSIPCEGAESFEDAYDRAARVLEMIREGRGRTVCVSHGGFMRCVFGRLLDIPFERVWRLRLLNVGSMLITYNDLDRFVVEGIGYTPEEVIDRCANTSLYDTFGAFKEIGDNVENRY